MQQLSAIGFQAVEQRYDLRLSGGDVVVQRLQVWRTTIWCLAASTWKVTSPQTPRWRSPPASETLT
jgi:hypothetical protein